MDVLAAVPVKDLVNAKQRLIPLLGADERRALARAMLEDVLAALAAALPGPIFVVTTDATGHGGGGAASGPGASSSPPTADTPKPWPLPSARPSPGAPRASSRFPATSRA